MLVLVQSVSQLNLPWSSIWYCLASAGSFELANVIFWGDVNVVRVIKPGVAGDGVTFSEYSAEEQVLLAVMNISSAPIAGFLLLLSTAEISRAIADRSPAVQGSL